MEWNFPQQLVRGAQKNIVLRLQKNLKMVSVFMDI